MRRVGPIRASVAIAACRAYTAAVTTRRTAVQREPCGVTSTTPQRLKIVTTCQTVTGIIVGSHSNDDGDIDMDLAVDLQVKNLLNRGNITKLNGNLHIEAICQAPVHPDVPDAQRSCANFTGTVPIPPNGAYVQVTGVYLADNNHGWMEIHPISVLTVLS